MSLLSLLGFLHASKTPKKLQRRTPSGVIAMRQVRLTKRGSAHIFSPLKPPRKEAEAWKYEWLIQKFLSMIWPKNGKSQLLVQLSAWTPKLGKRPRYASTKGKRLKPK
jgi:hypothetical protein